MAVINGAVREHDNGTTKVITWENLTTTNTEGTPVSFTPWGDRCVQAIGNFSGTAKIHIYGSNDGTNYSRINNVQGNAIDLGDDAIGQIQEVPLFIKPVISSGDGSADIDVIIVMRRSNQSRQ